MTNVSGPFDSAIEATTRFATESTFDKLNELKFDAVKKHIKLPKSPEGFMKKLALHGVACFFNKITFSQIKCFRNWKECSSRCRFGNTGAAKRNRPGLHSRI